MTTAKRTRGFSLGPYTPVVRRQVSPAARQAATRQALAQTASEGGSRLDESFKQARRARVCMGRAAKRSLRESLREAGIDGAFDDLWRFPEGRSSETHQDLRTEGFLRGGTEEAGGSLTVAEVADVDV